MHPDPPPPELAQALDLGGYDWNAIPSADRLEQHTPDSGWGGAVLVVGDDSADVWSISQSLRRNSAVSPILILISGRQINELTGRSELFDDFCLSPFQPREFEQRLTHALARVGTKQQAAELVVYEDLVLNVDTYEAEIAGRSLGLTYMEYELLKYLASHPGRVFTREILLSQVWGYDYFGGARTVDVHIRRLRSKLGEDYASMIQTVRSVGYSLGKSRR